MKRIISYLLCIALVLTAAPGSAIQAWADGQQPLVINDGYIEVQVSQKNAGFIVKTVEGDLLKKSDNNKKLLFHDGEYDTSFVSYRVDYGGGNVEDYLFGGKYEDSGDVTVSQAVENGPVVASWSAGGLTFIQSIGLANDGANEHGMVSIQLAVQNNSGSAVDVSARLLLDTCLGDQDYAYYQVSKDADQVDTITAEKIVDGAEYSIPMNFYATDNPHAPGVIAYSVNNSTSMPYQVAFGHWNNLASSLFDFDPDNTLGYTNPYNDYLTADSAYALYYNLNSIGSGGTKSLITYYGVYSHQNVPVANSVAVDVTAPLRLELNENKTGYERLSEVGIADFNVGVSFENFASDTAKVLDNVALSVRTTANIRSLGDNGEGMPKHNFDSYEPLNITYSNVPVGEIKTKDLYFQARLSDDAAYEKITIGVYDVSSTNGEIASDHLLGEKIIYIMLPGSDGDIPKVNFASMTPDIIYSSGTRHLFATVSNQGILEAYKDQWALKAYSVVNKNYKVDIPHSLISINNGVMDIALTNEIKLAPGSWYLQLEWSDAAVTNGIIDQKNQKQTGPQLYFVVSEDPKYKNDSYGVLCVVEYNKDNFDTNRKDRTETFGGAPSYRLESFADEDAFKDFRDNGKYVEILLVFRGEFTAEKHVAYGMENTKEYTYYSAVSTKTLDQDTREYKVDNTITVNGCMDFEGGTMLVYYENYTTPEGFKSSSINVEFDGELLTSDARTSVWKGKAILTKISQGESYSLRPYDGNGERAGNFNDQTIQLVWPSIYGAGQTLAGMVFKLAYGELGVMEDDDGKELGRVLSFSASLSLNFLKAAPGDDYAEPKVTYWSKVQDIYRYYDTSKDLREYLYSQDKVNDLFDFEDVDEEEPEKKGVTAEVMVQDILFGCGQGFVGLHFKVGIGVQNLIDGLPEISGELEVNTIGDYSFGFEGGMSLPTIQMEAKLSFKSYNNIPVPDEIYFYVGGFKPGINIDGGGVVWITGGGGGISNIYDSIFLTQSVPPLKLLLSVSFSIIQVMDGRANISLGLTGISLEAKDLKILGVLESIKSIYLGLEWYPDFDLQASISVDFFQGVIKGGGYIVLFSEGYKDFFFEIYLRANLGVPQSFPVVGGMELLGVDLGANNDKIWGGFKVLGIGYGVTYYWGQDSVDFTTGGQMAQPTYPDLLGREDIPVYYDQDRGQTLYARFGTNITPIGPARVLESSKTPRLMAAGLKTDPDKNEHMFNLGVYDSSSNNAAIVLISYDASSEADAKAKAGGFKVNSNRDFSTGTAFPLQFYDGTNADDPDTNANVTYNGGRASCSFTVTDPAFYNTDWYISTGEVDSTVMLYNVGLLPEVETVSGAVNGGNIDLTWTGTSLADLDTLSFYLTKSNAKGDPDNLEKGIDQIDAGIPLTVLDEKTDIEKGTATVAIPADTPTGDYYIRAVYSKEDQVNGMVFSGSKISYTNDNMPGACNITGFTPAGNLEYKLTIAEANNKTTGYLVTIYNGDGSSTDVAGMNFTKADSGATTFTIGGSYEYEGKTYGLTGGESYYAVVTPYNLLDSDGNGENDTIIYGTEKKTATVNLPAQITPTVTISADKPGKKVAIPSVIEGKAEQIDAFTENNVTFTAAITEASTGKWILDDTLIAGPNDENVDHQGTFTNTNSVAISLENITEGDHVLTVTGANGQGDRFRHDYSFRVDTTAPRLMLSSPVNGSLFNKNGSLTITGVTDKDALFTIDVGGSKIHDKETITALGGSISADGTFQFNINIPNPHSATRHDLVISAADALGNSLSKNVWVSHGGLADLDKLEILVNGSAVNGGHIPETMLGSPQPLALMGITNTAGGEQSFNLTNDSNVSWQCLTVEGSGQVDEGGELILSGDAMGILIGKLEVATGAYRTAALSFGREAPEGTVKVTSTTGGTVIGGGKYTPGRLVTLKATPNSGYSFAGWTITGASVENTGLSMISFVMPSGSDVTAHAEFQSTASGGGAHQYEPNTVITTATAQKGDLVEVNIPSGAGTNTYVAYYINGDGSRTFVPLSAPINGKLYFEAPVDGTYYFVDNRIAFRDAIDHWAESVIGFMTARGLFKGVGGNQFAPDKPMTRAMLVSVLHRLAGEPEARESAAFTDVSADAWYVRSVAWGYENGIVGGMGDGNFAPDAELTRDQMCAFIVRFLRLNGIGLPALSGDLSFADAGNIPGWAAEDIAYCRAMGLVGGYPDGTFLPQGRATRAENSVVLMGLIEAIVEELLK